MGEEETPPLFHMYLHVVPVARQANETSSGAFVGEYNVSVSHLRAHGNSPYSNNIVKMLSGE